MTVPAHIQPFVEVLGEDLAEKLLIELGGAPVYVSERPQGRSMAVSLLGQDQAAALARKFGSGMVKIPNGKPWLIERLSQRGFPVYEIARRLHMSERAVRARLNRRPDSSQPSLFD